MTISRIGGDTAITLAQVIDVTFDDLFSHFNQSTIKKEQINMATFDVTPEDMVVGKAVDPGWYQVMIADVKDSFAKTDNSLLTTIITKIVGPKEEGVKLYLRFSEKAKGFVVPFVEALTGQKMGKEGGKIELNAALTGRQLEVYVSRGEYKGKPTNEVTAYAPMGTNIK